MPLVPALTRNTYEILHQLAEVITQPLQLTDEKFIHVAFQRREIYEYRVTRFEILSNVPSHRVTTNCCKSQQHHSSGTYVSDLREICSTSRWVLCSSHLLGSCKRMVITSQHLHARAHAPKLSYYSMSTNLWAKPTKIWSRATCHRHGLSKQRNRRSILPYRRCSESEPVQAPPNRKVNSCSRSMREALQP